MSATIMVVSQLPPPLHGSAVMTAVFMETLTSLGLESPLLVERRFSRTQGEVERFNCRKVFRAPDFLRRILNGARRGPKVCIYFAAVTPLALFGDILALHIVKQKGVPIVLYLHGMGYRELANRGKVWRALVTRLFDCADQVIVLTDYQLTDVCPFVEYAKISVVPNTLGPVVSSFERDPEASTFLFLSNLIPEKGADIFIRAAALLSSDTNPMFIVAGAAHDKSYEATLKAKAVEAGLGGRIEFVGRVDETQKQRLFTRATALVFPSRYPLETFGLVVLEAKREGVPTLVSRHASLPSIVRDGIDGYVLPATDAVGFAARMTELATDQRVGMEMGKAAQVDYRHRFSDEAYAESWRHLLSKYLQRTESGPSQAKVKPPPESAGFEQ